MAQIASLCVYCGSSPGISPAFGKAARDLGAALAREGVSLVYGGGRVGLMGQVADACLQGGGAVVGIIPHFLYRRELGHGGATELVLVDSMHERKQRMFERADAICILPGGLGTLDEAVEVMTWRQLGLHDKPIILLDVDGYWQPFLKLVDHVVAHGFAKAEDAARLLAVAEAAEVLPAARRAGTPEIAAQPARL